MRVAAAARIESMRMHQHTICEQHLAYASSDRDREILKAYLSTGSSRKAAEKCGVEKSTVNRVIKRVITAAAAKGYCPEADLTHPVSPMHVAKGVSTLYGEDGSVKAQWVKADLDTEKRLAAIRSAIEGLIEDAPRMQPVKPPAQPVSSELATVYTLTDAHVGMLAWHQETGADWDLGIAERTLCGAVDHLVDNAPSSELGVVAQLGDFLHFDGLKAVTPEHGHLLDADGRFQKVVAIAVRILRHVVSKALAKHPRVHVIMAEGNHDQASSAWLRVLFSTLFENEPRVSVDTSPLPYYALQHGDVLLGWHHGHLSKNSSLPAVFAAEPRFRALWGATKMAYVHCGHRHHAEEKEYPGCLVVQHPTLAARDAYAARGGWISESRITSMTYHKRHGEVARSSVYPAMLEAA
jgi:hypothetical protein